jgi:transposase
MVEGTPQGAVISPLLANVYLHYVYDLWVRQWRQRQSTGDMIVVRYADDTIVGFEHQDDAERFLEDLSLRTADFELGLHPEKTRLIEFGRKAIARRRARGLSKPETFDFLGRRRLRRQRRDRGPRLRTRRASSSRRPDRRARRGDRRAIDKEIAASVKADGTAKRLMTVPGIGPVTASAIVATIQNASVFASGREFAAFLGLPPVERWTFPPL